MSQNRPNDPPETVYRIEPTRLENPPEAVADLVAELSASSAKLGGSLHPQRSPKTGQWWSPENRPYMRAPALSTGFFFFVLS